mmetsp:Transcript_1233/g.1750  ORF Transcript_1233/g.1750 Transcript_1233/m.1750 type:complete len:550 (-) Transcript_1233:96-1745(-)
MDEGNGQNLLESDNNMLASYNIVTSDPPIIHAPSTPTSSTQKISNISVNETNAQEPNLVSSPPTSPPKYPPPSCPSTPTISSEKYLMEQYHETALFLRTNEDAIPNESQNLNDLSGEEVKSSSLWDLNHMDDNGVRIRTERLAFVDVGESVLQNETSNHIENPKPENVEAIQVYPSLLVSSSNPCEVTSDAHNLESTVMNEHISPTLMAQKDGTLELKHEKQSLSTRSDLHLPNHTEKSSYPTGSQHTGIIMATETSDKSKEKKKKKGSRKKRGQGKRRDADVYQSQYRIDPEHRTPENVVVENYGTASSSPQNIFSSISNSSIFSSIPFGQTSSNRSSPNTGIANSAYGSGTTVPELILQTRVVNLAFATVSLFFEGFTILGNALTLHPARMILGAYLSFFSLILILYEIHYAPISKFIRLYIGLIYSAYGRAFVLFIMGGMAIGQKSIFMDLIGFGYVCTSFYTVYLGWRYPMIDYFYQNEELDNFDNAGQIGIATPGVLVAIRQGPADFIKNSVQSGNDGYRTMFGYNIRNGEKSSLLSNLSGSNR